MSNAGEMARENQALRERLSRLSEASLRISESLGSRLPAMMDLPSLRRWGASLLPEQVAESQVFVNVKAGILFPRPPQCVGATVPGRDACLTRPSLRGCFSRCLLLARTA